MAKLSKPVFLCGMMASGKTVNGKILADKLGIPFHDSDRNIENCEKMSIPEIFKKEGENYFRNCERNIIGKLCNITKPAIISLGGGSLQNQSTVDQIKSAGWLVYLHTPENTLIKRLKSSENRPLLQEKDRSAKIKKLLSERLIFYRQAHLTIDTNQKSPSQVTDEILEQIRNYEEHN